MKIFVFKTSKVREREREHSGRPQLTHPEAVDRQNKSLASVNWCFYYGKNNNKWVIIVVLCNSLLYLSTGGGREQIPCGHVTQSREKIQGQFSK